jgi:hypothetical protein
MVDNQINDHAHAAFFAASCKLNEIAERAVTRINVVVVGYIVSIVKAGGSLKRHQP